MTSQGHPMELINDAVDDFRNLVDEGHDSSLEHLPHMSSWGMPQNSEEEL